MANKCIEIQFEYFMSDRRIHWELIDDCCKYQQNLTLQSYACMHIFSSKKMLNCCGTISIILLYNQLHFMKEKNAESKQKTRGQTDRNG